MSLRHCLKTAVQGHGPGVPNFPPPKLRRLLSAARIHPVINQIGVHPYFPRRRLFDFYRENEVHVTAYGPLGCTPIRVLSSRKGAGPLEHSNLNSCQKGTLNKITALIRRRKGFYRLQRSTQKPHCAIEFLLYDLHGCSNQPEVEQSQSYRCLL